MNKTEIFLLMRFESPTVPVEDICDEFFKMSPGTAKQRAKAGTFPLPAFRMGSSQKLPWLVYIKDLADHIDHQHAQAKKEWVGA